VPYESLVTRAAEIEGLDPALARRLTQAHGQLRPSPEPAHAIAATMWIGIVTNCSNELGHQVAGLVAVSADAIVTAQSAGVCKPRPEP
jgi:hypothetical protein